MKSVATANDKSRHLSWTVCKKQDLQWKWWQRGMSILVLSCRRRAHFSDFSCAKAGSLDPPPPNLDQFFEFCSYIFL